MARDLVLNQSSFIVFEEYLCVGADASCEKRALIAALRDTTFLTDMAGELKN